MTLTNLLKPFGVQKVFCICFINFKLRNISLQASIIMNVQRCNHAISKER